MARSKNNRKKQKQAPREVNKNTGPNDQEQEHHKLLSTLDRLLDGADSIPDLEQRIKIYSHALKSIASSTLSTITNEFRNLKICDILEKRAEIYIEIGDNDAAVEDYNSALQQISDIICSDNNLQSLLERKASLYMNIGQMSGGQCALTNYENGIGLLQEVITRHQGLSKTLNDDQTTMDIDDTECDKMDEILLFETKSKLASAYCAAGELFMTDLCENENAEEKCESFINLALEQTDQNNNPFVDVIQLAASHRLSQNRGREAVDYILQAYEQFRVGCEELSSVVGLRDAKESNDGQCALEITDHSAVQSLPSFEFRAQTVKILLECANVLKEPANGLDQNNEGLLLPSSLLQLRKTCLDHAVDVSGSLLAENDEVIEVFDLL